jgi:hypothetical protein
MDSDRGDWNMRWNSRGHHFCVNLTHGHFSFPVRWNGSLKKGSNFPLLRVDLFECGEMSNRNRSNLTHGRRPFLKPRGRGKARVFARLARSDSGFPSCYAWFRNGIPPGKDSGFEGEPIDGLNQTKNEPIDRKTFKRGIWELDPLHRDETDCKCRQYHLGWYLKPFELSILLSRSQKF